MTMTLSDAVEFLRNRIYNVTTFNGDIMEDNRPRVYPDGPVIPVPHRVTHYFGADRPLVPIRKHPGRADTLAAVTAAHSAGQVIWLPRDRFMVRRESRILAPDQNGYALLPFTSRFADREPPGLAVRLRTVKADEKHQKNRTPDKEE
ncbi:MAG: hypothetical protein LBR29_06435 [Methylobacteriaceae bacterium]|jgi:hypothetical protein|nr:hypothetical protein [Methylobacteriaceae bacterium]